MTFEELKKMQKKYNRLVGVETVVNFIFVIMAFAFLFVPTNIEIWAEIIICIFAGISLLTWYLVRKSFNMEKYRKEYKAYFVEQNLKKSFTDLYYNHKEGLSKKTIEDTGMINLGDRYSSNDYVKGKYQEISFVQADVTIEKMGEDNYVTIFHGQWMIFEFPKKFIFRLQITDKKFGTASKGLTKDKTIKREIKKIITESDSFNKQFNVNGEDEFEAFYILDPAFIDRIEKLKKENQGTYCFCFYENQLQIAINNNKDAFEPPKAFRKLDEQKELEKVHQEIKTITDLIDFLRLGQNVLKKTA